VPDAGCGGTAPSDALTGIASAIEATASDTMPSPDRKPLREIMKDPV
jgi:hypothetical protein